MELATLRGLRGGTFRGPPSRTRLLSLLGVAFFSLFLFLFMKIADPTATRATPIAPAIAPATKGPFPPSVMSRPCFPRCTDWFCPWTSSSLSEVYDVAILSIFDTKLEIIPCHPAPNSKKAHFRCIGWCFCMCKFGDQLICSWRARTGAMGTLPIQQQCFLSAYDPKKVHHIDH